MVYIIRDHSMERFQECWAAFQKAAEEMNRRQAPARWTPRWRTSTTTCTIKDRMEIVTLAEEAMKAAGIAHIALILPIRGGTDGCMLTYKGLLCPNLPQRRAQCPRPV